VGPVADLDAVVKWKIPSHDDDDDDDDLRPLIYKRRNGFETTVHSER
jgi:hypothetical protein